MADGLLGKCIECAKKDAKKYNNGTIGIWKGIKKRCLLKTEKAYKNYGGRGIKICARWMKFKNFLEDMGERPGNLTIERIDNNGNYCKKNCKWASRKEQNNNRRDNRWLEFNGEIMTYSQWGERLGIKVGTIWWRIKRGWTIEKTLKKDPKHYHSHRKI